MSQERRSEIIKTGMLGTITSILIGVFWGFLVLNSSYSVCYLALIITPYFSYEFSLSVHEHFYGDYGGYDQTTLKKATIIGAILGIFLSLPLSVIIIVMYELSTIY